MDILTVGHSNLSLDAFVQLIQSHGVNLIVDVRSIPYSKWHQQFNRHDLKAHLLTKGIEYTWAGKYLGGLGKAEVKTDDPGFMRSMLRVVELSAIYKPALMCSEKDPKECHRAMKLTAYLLRNFPSPTVGHILQGVPDPVPAQEFEKQRKPKWGWYEFFPQGEYGKRK